MVNIHNTENENILSFMQKEGIINIDDVQKLMQEKRRQELLKKHPYSIFYDEKDKRWKTSIPDETKKNGRRLIAKRDKHKLEDVIIEYLAKLEDDEYIGDNIPTIRQLFPEWLKYKATHTDASSYIKRIRVDWNKYFESDPIVDIPIEDLTYLTLDKWAHNLVKDNEMTKKQYYNASTIIRQSLDYACIPEIGIITGNPFRSVHIKSNLFKGKSKPNDKTQVYLKNEQIMVLEECKRRFEIRDWCMTPLIVLLNFQLGLRIGEICAIKWSDIDGNYLHVQRMESTRYGLNEDGTTYPMGYKVVDYVKSEAGYRNVFLNSEAKDILKKIRYVSMKYECYDDNYIFLSSRKKTRGTSRTLTKYLEDICFKIGILQKSNHKIRKTYISSLLENGVNLNTVREQAGHEDEKTTLNNYFFNTDEEAEKEKVLENARNTRIAL